MLVPSSFPVTLVCNQMLLSINSFYSLNKEILSCVCMQLLNLVLEFRTWKPRLKVMPVLYYNTSSNVSMLDRVVLCPFGS